MDVSVEDKQLSDLLKKIFIPILLFTGLFGNAISIMIFNKKSMKKYSTFQYLTLLSILDLCVLYTGCSQILLEVYYDVDIRLQNQFFCKIHSFLVYFFTHYSSMLMALMSIDRTLAILSIGMTKFNSNFRTPFKLFIILGFCIALINCHFILFTKLNYQLIEHNITNSSMNMKFCYGSINSAYFVFLTDVYPW